MKDFWSIASALDESAVPFVVITMIASRGHAPQDPGAKAIVTENGLHWGTVGGGKVEARVIEDSKKLLSELPNRGVERPPAFAVTWNLQTDIGMTCGGEVTYVFEVHHRESWNIVVFGAGHVAQAVSRTLSTLDCSVTVIDPRPEWIEKLPQSGAAIRIKALCLPEPAQYVEKLDPRTFVVVMTQGHGSDMPILTAILKKFPDPIYLGSIGSDVKAIKIRADLKAAGIPEASISQLRCPIGLPLGSNDPSEIAISVAAELLQVRDQRKKKQSPHEAPSKT